MKSTTLNYDWFLDENEALKISTSIQQYRKKQKLFGNWIRNLVQINYLVAVAFNLCADKNKK